MELQTFIDLHKIGAIKPNTELPVVPTEFGRMRPIDWAMEDHHGKLIRYFKWQGEFFQAAKRHGVDIVPFAKMAMDYRIQVTSFREEPLFIMCFIDQVGDI